MKSGRSGIVTPAHWSRLRAQPSCGPAAATYSPVRLTRGSGSRCGDCGGVWGPAPLTTNLHLFRTEGEQRNAGGRNGSQISTWAGPGIRRRAAAIVPAGSGSTLRPQ
jgi:hypothetical protein